MREDRYHSDTDVRNYTMRTAAGRAGGARQERRVLGIIVAEGDIKGPAAHVAVNGIAVTEATSPSRIDALAG